MTTDKYPSRDPLWRMGLCNPTGLPSPGRDEHSYQYHPGHGGCKEEKQMPAARCISPVNSRCAQLWTTALSTWVSTSSYVSVSVPQTNAALWYPWASREKPGRLCALDVKGCAYQVRQATSPRALNLSPRTPGEHYCVT